jgi:hypothetical protein
MCVNVSSFILALLGITGAEHAERCFKLLAIVLALAGLLTALRAAYLLWKAGSVPMLLDSRPRWSSACTVRHRWCGSKPASSMLAPKSECDGGASELA